jgi:hypothetical protein
MIRTPFHATEENMTETKKEKALQSKMYKCDWSATNSKFKYLNRTNHSSPSILNASKNQADWLQSREKRVLHP